MRGNFWNEMLKSCIIFVLIGLAKGGLYSTQEEKELLRQAGCTEYDELLEAGACIPYHYRPQAIPSKGSTKIYTTIIQENVREVDNKRGVMIVDLKLQMQWIDDRIKTNFSEDDKKNGGIGLDLLYQINKIWKPLMYFHNITDWKSHEDSYNILGLTLDANHSIDTNETVVEYNLETKAMVYCDFNFVAYPMDLQTCSLRFESKSSGLDLELFDPLYTFHKEKEYGVSGFDIKVSFLDGYLDKKRNSNRAVGYDVKMERKLQPYFMMYYLPCMAILLVSVISFAVPLSAIPGRVGLLVTLFLTLTNLFIYEMSESPSATKLNDLGSYLLVSLFFVVFAMLEFALVLLIQRRQNGNKKAKVNESRKKSTYKHTQKISNISMGQDKIDNRENGKDLCSDDKISSLNKKQKVNFKVLNDMELSTDSIDMMACVLFITFYVLYNLFYWM